MWRIFNWLYKVFDKLAEYFSNLADSTWAVRCVRCGEWAKAGVVNCEDGWVCYACIKDAEYDPHFS